jgi:hypothetical protein
MLAVIDDGVTHTTRGIKCISKVQQPSRRGDRSNELRGPTAEQLPKRIRRFSCESVNGGLKRSMPNPPWPALRPKELHTAAFEVRPAQQDQEVLRQTYTDEILQQL